MPFPISFWTTANQQNSGVIESKQNRRQERKGEDSWYFMPSEGISFLNLILGFRIRLFCLDLDPDPVENSSVSGCYCIRKLRLMTVKKWRRQWFLFKNLHKIYGTLSRQEVSGSRSVFFLDLDPICPERLDPDLVNIKLYPKPSLVL